MKRLVLVVGVLVLLALGAAPAGFGYLADQRMDALIAEMEKSGAVKFSQVKRHRGWFSSTAEVSVEVSGELGQAYRKYLEKAGSGDGQPLRLTFLNRIHHGPVPFTAPKGRRPALAVIDTELIAVQGDRPVSKEDFPVELVTRLRLSGGGVTHIAMPARTGAIGEGDTQIDWQGLEGRVTFSADLRKVQARFSAPRLVVEDARTSVRLADARLSSDMRPYVDGLSLGKIAFSVGEVHIQPENGEEVELDGLSLEAASEEAGPQVIDSSVVLRMDTLRAAGMQFGPGAYLLALRNLDAAALAKIQETVEELQQKDLPPEQINMMLGATMVGLLPELLKRGPVLEIKEVSLDSEHGKLHGTGSLTVDTSNPAVLSNPLLLKDAVVADVELHIPEAFLVAIAAQGLQRELRGLDMEYPDDQVEAMARVRVQTRMSVPPVATLFVLEDGTYRFEGSIRKGRITVNGREIDPAAMGRR